jgi:hypothetical protein
MIKVFHLFPEGIVHCSAFLAMLILQSCGSLALLGGLGSLDFMLQMLSRVESTVTNGLVSFDFHQMPSSQKEYISSSVERRGERMKL